MYISSFLNNHHWAIKILIAILFALIINILIVFANKIIIKKAHLEKNLQKKNALRLFYRPIVIFLWIIAISYVFSVIVDSFKLESFNIYILKVRNVAIIINLCYFAIKWKDGFQEKVIQKSQKLLDRTSIEFVGKIISSALIFVAFLMILQIFGISAVPLIAFSGVGAAAFALASKDVIANMFGGMMLYITRPFSKGDFVQLPSQNISGYIEKIGWYNTSIRVIDKTAVYVPNSIFSNVIIINGTRRTHRMLEETIKIRYTDFEKLSKVIEDIKQMLKDNAAIDQALPCFVYFTSFSDFSLDILVKAYFITTSLQEYYSFRENILLSINEILVKNGVKIPYPTTSVEMLK